MQPASATEAHPSESRLRRTASEFVVGLTSPSLPSLAIAGLILVSGLVAACLLVTPERLADGLDRYFRGGGNQGALALSVDVFTLSRRPPDRPLVAVLGGSLAQAAVIEPELEARLRERGEAEIDAVELTSSRQTVWESIAILERLPAGTRGLVVFFVGPTKMAVHPEEIGDLYRTPRLGFRSDFIDRRARAAGFDPPPRTGQYLIDNRLFFQPLLTHAVRNAIKAAVGRALPPAFELVYHDGGIGEEEWSEQAASVRSALAGYPELMTGNLRLVDSLVALVRERTGMSVVLIESPISPRFEREWIDDLYRVHKTEMRGYARRSGLPYLDLQPGMGLVQDDFRDWAHLGRRSAGRRFTSVLADTLATLLESRVARGEGT